MAKGYVKKVRGTWYYTVVANGKVVFSDNTCDWRRVFDDCLSDVLVAKRVTGAGHTFAKSFPELVDEASEF